MPKSHWDFNGKHLALVEPDWSYKVRRKNWMKYMKKRYLPIGLLKLGTLARGEGATIELLRGNKLPKKKPDLVFVTSLFTYWWQTVWKTVKTYRFLYHDAKVVVGGIYASIMPEHAAKSGCDEVFTGLVDEAERVQPAYDLVKDCEFCVIHASRGCIHRCPFCFTYKLEPKYIPKESIIKEIVKPKVSFLDNNLLANPNIENILQELVTKKVRTTYCLSGVEAKLVTLKIAQLMKKARFQDIRIAFDRADEEEPCKNALKTFEQAGFKRRDISVFMLYNFTDSFETVERRRVLIGRWGSQIIAQRYIPIPSLEDTFLHPNWTAEQCSIFARNCREQSICTRFCHTNPFEFFGSQASIITEKT